MENKDNNVLSGLREIAEYLQISKDTAAKLVKESDFPVRFIANRYTTSKTAIDNWLRSDKVCTKLG